MSIKKRLLLMVGLVILFLAAICSFVFFSLDIRKTSANVETVSHKKVCYLTFDDGPSSNTQKVLDILKAYNVQATFFVIGSEIEESDREILERIQKEGHVIGLHSYAHDFDKVYCGAEHCVQDYLTEYELLKSEYGIDTKVFRFPGGSVCEYMKEQREDYIHLMKENGFLCFDWHVSGEDSVGTPTVYSIQKNVMTKVLEYENPIVLLHDSGIADATVEALPGIIEQIREADYCFQTLSERKEYIFRWKSEE